MDKGTEKSSCGTQDRTVPIAQSDLLLAKYQKAGASAEFFKVEGAPHAFWSSRSYREMLRSGANPWTPELEKHLVDIGLTKN